MKNRIAPKGKEIVPIKEISLKGRDKIVFTRWDDFISMMGGLSCIWSIKGEYCFFDAETLYIFKEEKTK